MDHDIKKIVLAYSGGLDTSVIPSWLRENYGCPVIAYASNLGQEEDTEALKKNALESGADEVIVEDLQEEFISDYVWPALRANAVYENNYLLGTSLARPLIAKRQITLAKNKGANAVSHGATGKGNDQVRFELAYMALEPSIKIIAPWKIWDFKGREDLLKYADERGISVPVTRERPYSSDRNLLHVSFEGGVLEDPWQEPSEDMFLMTVSPQDAPDEVTYVEIDFEHGNPVAVDGERLSPANILRRLNELGGKNAIGRVDMVENRYVGMKSRGVYETPGGTILRIAHIALESITMDREVMHIRDGLVPKYSELVYYGYWFAPEREMLQGLIDETQKDVTGTVRLKLYKGNCTVVGRKSDFSLFNQELATFERDTVFRQSDAEGFIRLSGLRLKISNLMKHGR